MKFFSTKNRLNQTTFRNAVMRGIADDSGLYMPVQIPQQSISFLQSLKVFTFQELTYHLVQQYIDDISKSKLQEM